MNCDEMAEEKLTVCKQELLWAFARCVSISSNFLYWFGLVFSAILFLWMLFYFFFTAIGLVSFPISDFFVSLFGFCRIVIYLAKTRSPFSAKRSDRLTNVGPE